MYVRRFRGVLVIAALASTACTATSDGLELGVAKREQQAAVTSSSQGNDVGASCEQMLCPCMLEMPSSGMSEGGEKNCPMAGGTLHHALPPAAVMEGDSAATRR